MRTNRVSRHFSVWLGATAALAIASSATAQTANAESAEAQAERGGLEEITVTARRRAESAQDIPVAITALSGAAMQRMDITNLEKVAAMTPQLQVGRSAVGSGAQLTMRGIGSNSSSVGIEQSVAVIVDGAYYGNGRIINEGFFDLERLELLKGPQALFFGKNATAGVISITTANPTREFFGSSRIGLEVNAAQLYGEQILSGPLTSTLSGRVAVRLSRMFRGYTKGLATDQPYTTRDLATGNLNPHIAPAGPIDSPGERELVGRVSLMWEPTADFTAILKVGGTINKSNNPAWNNNIFSCPGGFSQLQPRPLCGLHRALLQWPEHRRRLQQHRIWRPWPESFGRPHICRTGMDRRTCGQLRHHGQQRRDGRLLGQRTLQQQLSWLALRQPLHRAAALCGA